MIEFKFTYINSKYFNIILFISNVFQKISNNLQTAILLYLVLNISMARVMNKYCFKSEYSNLICSQKVYSIIYITFYTIV